MARQSHCLLRQLMLMFKKVKMAAVIMCEYLTARVAVAVLDYLSKITSSRVSRSNSL